MPGTSVMFKRSKVTPLLDASTFFESSRTTACQRLQHLEQGRWIVRHGRGGLFDTVSPDKAHSALKRMKRIVRDGEAGDFGQ